MIRTYVWVEKPAVPHTMNQHFYNDNCEIGPIEFMFALVHVNMLRKYNLKIVKLGEREKIQITYNFIAKYCKPLGISRFCNTYCS